MEGLIANGQVMLLMAVVLFAMQVLMRVVLWASVREPNPRTDQVHELANSLFILALVAGGLALLLFLLVWGLSPPPTEGSQP